MKKIKLILVIIFLSTNFLYSQNQNINIIYPKVAEKDLINKPFPNFSLARDSAIVTNEILKGKIVYINFWFAACSPCMQEMPQLNELYDKFKEDSNFVFISITYDEGKIETIKAKFEIKYPIYAIPIFESFRLNQTHSYPANIIIDKNGIITFYETGTSGINLLISKHFKNKIYPKLRKLLNGG